MLEIAFANMDLRDLCEDAEHACSQLGADVAASLRTRLSDIEACETILELPTGDPKFIDGKVHISLAQGSELVLAANHHASLTDEHGNPDWNRVRRVKVLSIGPQERHE